MKLRLILLLLIACSALSLRSLAYESSFRKYVSDDGREVVAKVENYNPVDGSVVIRMEDNRKFTVPFERFSKADQEYLINWRDEYERSFTEIQFMTHRLEASRIVFIIDGSGSMSYYGGERWKRLLSNIRNITEKFEQPLDFNFIIFNDKIHLFSEDLVPATELNIMAVNNWLRSFQPDNGTDLTPAVVKALSMEETEVFVVLTDGLPSDGGNGAIQAFRDARRTRAKPFKVFTIGYQQYDGEAFLKRMAEEFGGRYVRR